jgi:hypothetical protein
MLRRYTDPMKFTATKTGPDSLGLCELLERFAAEQWLPKHVSAGEAGSLVLDLFRRKLLADLGAIELKAE